MGDYIVMTAMALNLLAAVGYAWGGEYVKVLYWVCALGLNLAVLKMRG